MKHDQQIEPEIIYRKAKSHGHAHHGGAWKIAYADFVTAMMAFFMLLWILGATTEDQRRGIADYFTPTVLQLQNSGGSNGLFGGRSVMTPEGAAARPQSTGRRPVTTSGSDAPVTTASDGKGKRAGRDQNQPAQTAPQSAAQAKAEAAREADEARMIKAIQKMKARLESDPTLKGLQGQVRFVRTRDGLRIDLVERADFAMFTLGTSAPTRQAGELVQMVARAIDGTPNRLAIRGHTDALGYTRPGGASNWSLSSARADATRRLLTGAGIDGTRFRRIEGVADTDPFVTGAPLDPRNRRISITLLYEDPA